MSRELEARLAQLESENRVLREENLLLTEHAEEALLLRTVAEVAGWSNDQDSLLNDVLERIAILRDIPLCACGFVEDGEFVLPWCYSSLIEGDCRLAFKAPAQLLERLGSRNGCVVKLPDSGYQLELSGDKFEVRNLFLLSFHTHAIEQGIFLFGSVDEHQSWTGPQIFLRQAVDMVAARLDRLDLVGKLQQMNRDLDLRVHERTAELKQSNLELGRLQTLLKNVINSMPSALVAVDATGTVLQWNQEASRLSGTDIQAARGRALAAVFPGLYAVLPAEENPFLVRDARQYKRVSLKIADGSRLLSDVSVFPLEGDDHDGAVIRADDVTEQARLEEVMVQAEKMLSVGGLAAGMAHEINNPLAGILQNLQVADNRLAGNQGKNRIVADQIGLDLEKMHEYLKQRGILGMIRNATENGRRAAGIVDNILSFSRQSESKKSPHDLAALIERTLALLDNDYDLEKGYDFRKVSISRQFQEGLPRVPCEETKIQQVLLNLLRNAAQAMRSHEAPGNCRLTLDLSRQGRMAQIKVYDNGPGLEPEVRRRIFEPFFTTKGARGGTGLGLSVSYFIIAEQHGGELLVEDNPQGGCCFVVRLPFSDEDAKGADVIDRKEINE